VKRPGLLAALLLLLPAACAPRVTVRPGDGTGATVFSVRSSAESVTLAGSMTGWRRRPLVRLGDRFELDLTLPPGRYEYRLEETSGGGASQVIFPEGAERTPDGFGGENALLRVR
jgi:hypothetical protein